MCWTFSASPSIASCSSPADHHSLVFPASAPGPSFAGSPPHPPPTRLNFPVGRAVFRRQWDVQGFCFCLRWRGLARAGLLRSGLRFLTIVVAHVPCRLEAPPCEVDAGRRCPACLCRPSDEADAGKRCLVCRSPGGGQGGWRSFGDWLDDGPGCCDYWRGQILPPPIRTCPHAVPTTVSLLI